MKTQHHYKNMAIRWHIIPTVFKKHDAKVVIRHEGIGMSGHFVFGLCFNYCCFYFVKNKGLPHKSKESAHTYSPVHLQSLHPSGLTSTSSHHTCFGLYKPFDHHTVETHTLQVKSAQEHPRGIDLYFQDSIHGCSILCLNQELKVSLSLSLSI